MIVLEGAFPDINAGLHNLLLEAPQVDTGHWQSLTADPRTVTRELQHVTIKTDIPEMVTTAQIEVQPNLPWAEDHFAERVSGDPSNPGKEYMNWPWYRGGVEEHKGDGKFSHTYQERFWPKFAGGDHFRDNEGSPVTMGNWGVRYQVGDYLNLIKLLATHPYTRQAYLPIWFPEDTGAAHGERVPCSLGYHFMLREGRLHCAYYMRSVDFLRYFRDDVYMAMRLTQYTLDVVSSFVGEEDTMREWQGVVPGDLHMHISSLHVFEGDMPKMYREKPERR